MIDRSADTLHHVTKSAFWVFFQKLSAECRRKHSKVGKGKANERACMTPPASPDYLRRKLAPRSSIIII